MAAEISSTPATHTFQGSGDGTGTNVAYAQESAQEAEISYGYRDSPDESNGSGGSPVGSSVEAPIESVEGLNQEGEQAGEQVGEQDVTPISQAAVDQSHALVAEAFKGITEQSGADTMAEIEGWARDNMSQERAAIFDEAISRGGEDGAKAIELLVNEFKSANPHTSVSASDNAIYNQVAIAFQGMTEQSGQDSWNELAGWAKGNLPKAERVAFNHAMQAGGITATLAVDSVIQKFHSRSASTEQAPQHVSQDMIGLSGDNTPSAVSTGGDLSRSDYNSQVDALIAKGHDYNTSKDIQRLQKQRQRSAGRGR